MSLAMSKREVSWGMPVAGVPSGKRRSRGVNNNWVMLLVATSAIHMMVTVRTTRSSDHQMGPPPPFADAFHAFSVGPVPRRATARTNSHHRRPASSVVAPRFMAAKKSTRTSSSSPSIKGFGSPKSVSSVAQVDRSAKTRQFYEYMERQHPGAGSSLRRTALATSPDGLRGVVATKDIAKGEDIISVPYELAINLGRQGDDPTLPALELLRDYMSALRHEPAVAPPRRAYYEMLPALGSSEDYRTSTDFFSPEALRELQSPFIAEETMSRRERVERRVAELETAEGDAAVSPVQLQWAVWIITSRVLTVQGETPNEQYRLLIPYLDMCNHDRESPHVLTGRAVPNGVLRVVAGKNVKAGDFINICYGGGVAGNDRFVQDYGFLDPAPEAFRIVARQWTGKIRGPAEGSLGGKFESQADCARALEALGVTTVEQDEADLSCNKDLPVDIRTALQFRIGVKKALAELV